MAKPPTRNPDRGTRRQAAAQLTRDEVLIATLGDRPAVVTTTLDLLLAEGYPIREVVVIHTSSSVDELSGRELHNGAAQSGTAIERLDAEFPGGDTYLYNSRPRPCAYRRIPLTLDDRLLCDIDTPDAAAATFRTMYQALLHYKNLSQVVHIGVGGGRKTMMGYAMVSATVLFDYFDRMWYLHSSPAFDRSDRMHPIGDADAMLMPLPLVPHGLGFLAPVRKTMASGDPTQAIEQMHDEMARRREEQCLNFINQGLTHEERRLVKTMLRELLVHRISPTVNWLARQLYLSDNTVRKRLSEIYAKMTTHFDLYDRPPDSRVLIGLLAPYFNAISD
jgi:CRISPR-associated protein (TIGR02584 family)